MTVPFGRLLGPALEALTLFESGKTLDAAVGASLTDSRMRPALQAVLYDLTRRYFLCDCLVQFLSARPPTDNVRRILMLALSELLLYPTKRFALVNETVNFAKANRKTSAASDFVNACLRRFCRESDALVAEAMKNDIVRLNAPEWLLKKFSQDLGRTDAEALLKLAQIPPRLVLRVNRRKTTPQAWCNLAQEKGLTALTLGQDGVVVDPPCGVEEIPGFNEGLVSVQDAGAQLAARWLAPQDKESILDACAAPGGKTCHILELADADVLALEISPERAERIRENLKRLNLKARVVQADAADTASWAGPDSRFDAVLLDAPCTASGILRRHPDVAFLRQSSDIVALAKQQKILLDALWPRVKFGGRLLYVVCSVFKEEGPMQIADFLKRHKDARAVPLADGLPATLTVLPRDSDTEDALGLARIRDGFFYALLTKG